MLDTDAKQAVVAARLAALGPENPRIYGQVQPYSINHDVARGEWVTRDCQSLPHRQFARHCARSRLAAYTPGGVLPHFVQDTNVAASGEIHQTRTAHCSISPRPRRTASTSSATIGSRWVDWFGALVFVGVLLAWPGTARLRFIASLRQPKHKGRIEEVYMYDAYERFWHWLQTITIVLLLFTGLIIHRPDIFGALLFPARGDRTQRAGRDPGGQRGAVAVLAPGERRNHASSSRARTASSTRPSCRPSSTCGASSRARPHPFEKDAQTKKLNPLQQITYFGLLNVLLPLQIITGALMWGVQRWPDVAPVLGRAALAGAVPHRWSPGCWPPSSWRHVYLTTTGARPARRHPGDGHWGGKKLKIHDGRELHRRSLRRLRAGCSEALIPAQRGRTHSEE